MSQVQTNKIIMQWQHNIKLWNVKYLLYMWKKPLSVYVGLKYGNW